jgi:type 2 lantibiotic biosynthesis protein LanM
MVLIHREDEEMKELVSKSSIDTQKCWQSASWYRAMILTERVALLREDVDVPSLAISSDSEIAKQRLVRWKGQIPFNKDESYFAQRLAADSLTEDDLLMLLTEPIEVIQARLSAAPAWLEKLQQAFSDLLPSSDGTPSPLSETVANVQTLSVHDILIFIINRGLNRINDKIYELNQKNIYMPFNNKTVLPLILKHVSEHISRRLFKTIVLELSVARVQERLQGDTPEERFQKFLRYLCQPEGMVQLLEEYPVLARLSVEAIDRWVRCELELLERLCADWDEIRSVFCPANDPGVLVRILGEQGDTHRGGRSVTILVWSSGFRLVYKPRAMDIDVHFQELLSWLNDLGYQPAFRTFKVINKGTYGWAEFVQASSCSSREEVERFYQRQGGYLALLYALQAADVHGENLIAAGEYPMLIDLEALFQPQISVKADSEQRYLAIPTVDLTVLRVGLLPQRIWSNGQSEGVDISGLGGQAGQLTPQPVTKWESGGGDGMRIIRERVPLQVANHRPKLDDQEVDTLEYCDSIIAGFTTVYRLLLQHSDVLLQEMLPRFAHDEIRCIMRPTPFYIRLLNDSYHPDVLRDALDRDRLLDRLWVGVHQQPHLSRLICAERADLLAGDIPMFTTYPDSLDFFTSHGEAITEFFAISGLETARKQFSSFDEEDLERQIWVIKASFTSMMDTIDKPSRSTLQLQPSYTQVTYERLIKAARNVGDRLCRLAMENEDAVGWLGITSVREREWQVRLTGVDLYSGASGIILFLGYLGKLTGENQYTSLAKRALSTIRYLFEYQKDIMGVGAFDGIGSFIYLLSHLGALWNDQALYEEAEEAVKLLPDAIAQDQAFDVMLGSAGCIAALLSLYTVLPSEATLAAAIQCGDHLIDCAKPMQAGIGWMTEFAERPLTGLSHGNAGIALNLLRLFAASGEERFRQAAIAAIEYERSVFDPEKQIWPDFRKDSKKQIQNGTQAEGEEEHSFMVAWCHGAPGIGLARLESLHFIDDQAVRAEIDVALQTMLAKGFGWNHSLCHGDMGNLETLLVATQLLANPRYKEWLQRLTAMLVDSVDKQGWVAGAPHGVETPGLMTGIAGTGYAMLRLASPGLIPSVLLLASPLQ